MMLRCLLFLPLVAGDAAFGGWQDLGAGGCREAGGRYEKKEVIQGVPDAAACRAWCETEEACTAIVFGTRNGDTFCHLLSGGPYTHTDGGMSGFVCQVRSMNCTVPEATEAMGAGYDVRECNGARSGAVPSCNMKCAFGYSGTPVATCRRHGGSFVLEGCARLSLQWAFHGGGSCSAMGSPGSTASRTTVSLVACMAACQDTNDCAAVTYDLGASRCDLYPETPLVDTATDRDSTLRRTRECWRLGAASVVTRQSVDEVGASTGSTTRDISRLPGNIFPTSNGDTIPVSMAPLLFVGGLLTGIAAVVTVVCFIRRRPVACDLEEGGGVGSSVAVVDCIKTCPAAVGASQRADARTTYIEPFEADQSIDVKKKEALRAAGTAPPGGSPRSSGSTTTRASTPPAPPDPMAPAEASVPEPPAPPVPSPTYAWLDAGAPPLRASRTSLPPLVDAPHAGRALSGVRTDTFPARTRSFGF